MLALQEWDEIKKNRTGALDNILDSLGSQLVPPDFHNTSPLSSLFGSHNASGDEAEDTTTHGSGSRAGQSPTETLRDFLQNGMSKLNGLTKRQNDRSKWKTLRDFVDERGIEDLLDKIEAERNVLDVRLLSYLECLSGLTVSYRICKPEHLTIRSRYKAPSLLLEPLYPQRLPSHPWTTYSCHRKISPRIWPIISPA
jgi:autophagy-related protein 17